MATACPYKGLLPYEEKDFRYFFGRQDERQIIAANLKASRLTLLYGASGVGKSSVLQAGVVHDLRKELIRNRQRTGSPGFAVASFGALGQWRDDPVQGLVLCLRHAVAEVLDTSVAELPTPSADLADTLSALTEHLKGELFIILDQFEEYFLYHPRDDKPIGFAAQFVKAMSASNLRVNFLISLREEAVARLDRFKGRIAGLFDNYLRVDHLDVAGARLAIEEPVKEYNKTLPEGQAPISIEPGVVESVLEQVKAGKCRYSPIGEGSLRGAPEVTDGAARIDTGYLQLVLTRLWNEEVEKGSRDLRLEILNDRLGGAENIVRTHLDQLVEELSPEGRKAAAKMFRYLVTPSGTKIAQSLKDLADFTKLPEERLKPVLEHLSGKEAWVLHKVTPPLGGEAVRYEIAHDVLAEAILAWRQRYEQELTRQEAEEHARKEAEQRSQRRLKVLGGFALVIFILVGFVALVLDRSAEHQKVLAGRLAAQARATTDPRVKALLAAESLQREPTADAYELLYSAVSMMPREYNWRPPADKDFSTVAFSPDGSQFVAGTLDGTIYVFEARKDGSIGSAPQYEFSPGEEGEGLVSHIAFAFSKGEKTQRRLLAAASRHAAGVWVRVLDLTNKGERIASLSIPETLRDMALSPDGQWLAALNPEGRVIFKRLSKGSVVVESSFEGDKTVVDLAFSTDPHSVPKQDRKKTMEQGQYLLIGMRRDGTLRQWQLKDERWDISDESFAPEVKADRSDKVLKPKNGEKRDLPVAVAISADGSRFATAGKDGNITIFSSRGKHHIDTKASVVSLVLGPEGRSLVAETQEEAGQQSRQIQVWDVDVSTEVLRVTAGKDIGNIAASPKATWLAVARPELRLWHRGDIGISKVFRPEMSGVVAARIEDLLLLVSRASSAEADHKEAIDKNSEAKVIFRSLNSETAESRMLTLQKSKGALYTAWSLSRDGRYLVAGTDDGKISVWDTASGKLMGEPQQHESWIDGKLKPIQALVISDNGQRIVSHGQDGTGLLWKVIEGELAPWDFVKASEKFPRGYWLPKSLRVALSRKGRWLAVAPTGGGFKLWDFESPEKPVGIDPEISQRGVEIETLMFSPDDRWLVTGGADNTVDLWEINKTGLSYRRKLHSRSPVVQMAFDREGKRIAISSTDKSLALWHLAKEKEDDREITLAFAGEADAEEMAFSSDGLRLATLGTRSDRLRIWSTEIGKEKEIMRFPVSDRERYVDFVAADQVVTISNDGLASYWPSAKDHYQEMACMHLGKGLSLDEWEHWAGKEEMKYYKPICGEPRKPEAVRDREEPERTCENDPIQCRRIIMRAMQAHQREVGLIIEGQVALKEQNEKVIHARAVTSLVRKVSELVPGGPLSEEVVTRMEIREGAEGIKEIADRLAKESESELRKFIEAVERGDEDEINRRFKHWEARCKTCHRDPELPKTTP